MGNLMHAETALLRANAERTASYGNAVEAHGRRRISAEEEKRLYELAMAGKDAPLSNAAYGYNPSR